jgi:RNA recognition motif-containing protein
LSGTSGGASPRRVRLDLLHFVCRTDKKAERRQALEAVEAQKKRATAPAAEPAPEGKPKSKLGGGLKSTAPHVVIPDEYLPPNKTLFLQNVPDEYDADALTALFGRFEGFREVRLVPGRKGIAFVEYETEAGSISAKERMAGVPLGEAGLPIKVTFQRS